MNQNIQFVPKNNWVYFLIFAALVFITFGNALFNGLVYDDHYLIKDNHYIKSFSYLGKVLTSDVAVASPIEKPSGYYRPMSMFFLMLMYKVWGLKAFGLHLTTVLIHLFNTFFVFLIIRKISKNVALAFLTACLFAVHPVHVEAVAPVFNYMGILATFFSLASFLSFIKSYEERKLLATLEAGRQRRPRSLMWFALSVFLFFCAVFSKEEAIVLPAVFALYDFYFISDLRWKNFAKHLLRYSWFLLPATAYITARVIFMPKAAALGFWKLGLGFSVAPVKAAAWQIVSTFRIFFDYLGILVLPANLSAYYLLREPWQLSGVKIFFSIAVVLSLLIAAFYFARKQKVMSFFVFFFFITTFMFSNIIPVGGLFAERFMYLPSLSFCVILAMGFKGLFDLFSKDQKARGRLLPLIGFVAILGSYIQASAVRNYVWRNDVILWLDTCKKTPESYRPFQYLGDAYVYYGEDYYERALTAYQEALKRPGVPEIEIVNSIGRVYGLMNRHDLALREFKRAMNLNTGLPVGYYNVGITYYFMGDYQKALSCFQAGLALDKEYFWFYYGKGLVCEKEGRLAEARDMFRQALSLKPDFKMAEIALAELENNGQQK